MKKLCFIFLLTPLFFYGQEFEYRVSSEKKIDDDLVLQTGTLTIFNNSDQSLCLRLSSTFPEKILSRDTVQLASMGNDSTCQYFKLWISDDNKKDAFEDFKTYPLVLNSKGSFTATISILLNLNCHSSWLEYRYIGQEDVSSAGFGRISKRNKKWDARLKSKFHSVKIPLESGTITQMLRTLTCDNSRKKLL